MATPLSGCPARRWVDGPAPAAVEQEANLELVLMLHGHSCTETQWVRSERVLPALLRHPSRHALSDPSGPREPNTLKPPFFINPASRGWFSSLVGGFFVLFCFCVACSFVLLCFPLLNPESKPRPACLCHSRKRMAPLERRRQPDEATAV